MKPQTWLSMIIIAGAAFAAMPAYALIQVIGDGQAHACFMAAKSNVNVNAGIATCTAALQDGNLSYHDRAGTLVNRGVLEDSAGRHNDAMRDYEEGLRLAPDLGDAYVDRGAALIYLKRYDDAITDINKGIALGMSYPHVGYYNRAVVEELMGHYKDSYYDYKHALEIEPDFKLAEDRLKDFTVTTVKTPG